MLKWQEFRIGDLFEKIKINSLKYKTKDLPNVATNEYDLPALTAGIQNQGLNNYVPRKNATILKNVISISANGANTGATFYQSKEFTVLQDAYAIKWIYTENILTESQYLFLVGTITKRIFGNYEWTNKAGWERIKDNCISLPVRNGKPDYDIMETFISAVQKLVIKNVVQYTAQKIQKSFELRQESKSLLEKAKQMVEHEIEGTK
ncbi:MAG: restriction endonuclease subunit S [Spirochaetia bacterium]|nr:restriction endonuclease subunit S [Spirochaetia bacterium]